MKYILKYKNPIGSKSNYLWDHDENILWIVDLDLGKTVTNNIENVLQEISKSIDVNKYHIIYRDTEGIFDGVRLNKKGVSFFSINSKELEEAKKRVIEINRVQNLFDSKFE